MSALLFFEKQNPNMTWHNLQKKLAKNPLGCYRHSEKVLVNYIQICKKCKVLCPVKSRSFFQNIYINVTNKTMNDLEHVKAVTCFIMRL